MNTSTLLGLALLASSLWIPRALSDETANSKQPNALDWQDPNVWKDTIHNSVNFFFQVDPRTREPKYFDKETGSFIDQIQFDGSVNPEDRDKRHLVAQARLVYGLAHASRLGSSYYLERAKGLALFMLQRMVARDQKGMHFLEKVSLSEPVTAPTEPLMINKQAYAIAGLVALYDATRDYQWLHEAKLHYSFLKDRFHDPVQGGFFESYDPVTKRASSVKSFNSTVYVATSFLLDLARLDQDPDSQREYRKDLTAIGEFILDNFWDGSTGWIHERFVPQDLVDYNEQTPWIPSYEGTWQESEGKTIGVVGHNFQAAWTLIRLARYLDQSRYLTEAEAILRSMLAKPGFDSDSGGVFDVFERETNAPKWHHNKVWWQQAEAIQALLAASKAGLDIPEEAIAKTAQFYLENFVDWERGGEFQMVQANGVPIREGVDAMKATQGKSVYHSVELGKNCMFQFGLPPF